MSSKTTLGANAAATPSAVGPSWAVQTSLPIKRNIIAIFMSIELMLNGVNLSFVAFAAHWHVLSGQVFVFFVMVVAAAETAVGLAIIIAVYRTRETLNIDQVNLLKL